MDRINRVLMACALLLIVVACALLMGGCGAHQSGAYDPGPPGGAHWRPREPVDAGSILTDLRSACRGGLPTAVGRVRRHSGPADRSGISCAVPADETHHWTARILPSGRVTSPCWVADTRWNIRSVTYDGHWLVLADRCAVYDEAQDTVVWDVAMSRKARGGARTTE